MFAIRTLTALKLDWRKPGFYLLVRGKETEKDPRTQAKGPRLLIENLMQRWDFQSVQTSKAPRLDGALLDRIGQDRADRFRSPVKAIAASCLSCLSMERSRPHLCHFRLEEVKLRAWNSGPGKNGPQWRFVLSPFIHSNHFQTWKC